MSENYIPLYRKYRPQTLETLVGQEHIKKTLTGAIELGKISHAYLFTGPRGTGKTSTARILAKSLNCKNGPTVHPCGECESCKDITNSIPIDVIEIDAASNRKVEDTQNLLEKIQYVPVNGKYKIYIIDEVHMLTNHAFNALLKTLEEPPENVIFILATTEVHKVLDTIKSRCQRFDFKRITTEDIVKHLKWISKQEKINITDDALLAIAKNSAGGMRDSISLLDQLSIIGISKEITTDDVNSILGRISFDVLLRLTEKIISSEPSGAIELLNEIYNSGNEPLQILTNLSEYFKNLLMAKTCAKELLPELTGLNEPQIKDLSVQAQKLETQQIVFLIERISYYIKEVKSATNQYLWLEVSMIDLSNMTENTTLMDLQNRVSRLEGGEVSMKPHTPVPATITRPAPIQPEGSGITGEAAATVTETKEEPIPAKTETIQESGEETAPVREDAAEEEFTPPPVSKKLDKNDISVMWENLLSSVSSESTQALLKQLATPVQINKEGVILTFRSQTWVNSMNEPAKKQQIINAANIVLNNKDTKVVIRLAQSNDKPAEVSAPKPVKEETSEQDDEPENSLAEAQQAAQTKVQRIESDQEKMVMDLFDGKYVG